MKNKIITLLCLAMVTVGGVGLVITPTAVYADDPFCDNLTNADARKAAGCDNGAELTNVIKNILEAVIGVAGFVAVVFIVVGGVQYMTSTGDSGKIKKAKDTILYALIGLIICALSFAIVNWTVGVVNKSDTPEEEEVTSYFENSIAKIAE